MLNWRQNAKNTKVELYSAGDIVKDDSGSYAVFTEQGPSASANDGRESDGYHLQIARLRWTSSRRSIRLIPK